MGAVKEKNGAVTKQPFVFIRPFGAFPVASSVVAVPLVQW